MIKALLALAIALVAAGSANAGSDYSAKVTNPWFPLAPGTTHTYIGEKDGKPARDIVTVTRRTKTIEGAPCVVVSDRLYLAGHLAERTTDYYSQDAAGNVWYFGEDTRTFDEHGNVESTEGSWEAGQGRNLPGILMLVHPRSGQTYRQEFGPGVAVDMATVLSVHRHVTVPAASYRQVVETKEYSCLEKGLDHKFYAPGVGLIAELALANGQEHIELTSFVQ
jgi:hypothetical protein